MFTRYFRMPQGFDNFLYLSQVQQAIAIRTAVEFWRRLRPMCMGTLYWQLNDNWPVCSWSSVEYGGKWKLLHYFARRFYNPVVVSAFQQGESVEVWVTNDTTAPLAGSVTLEVRDFAGKVLKKEKLTAKADAGSAKMLREYKLSNLIAKPSSGFMVLTLEAGGDVFRSEHFFCEYKKCELAAADVQMQVQEKAGKLSVTLSTDKPAFFVTVNADGIRGEWDDNCFTLLPGAKRVLTFAPKQAVSLTELKKSLTVRHLRQTYE
jgi:beta-mannosidase